MSNTDTRHTSSRVRRGMTWSTTSNLLLRLGNLGVSMIVARLISPTEFGVFAVALTVWAICGTMAEFGLGTDLVRSRDPERRIPTVTTLGLITSGMLAATMFLFAPLIAQAFESPASTNVIRVMSISMLVFGLSIVPGAMLQREIRQGHLFAANAAGLVASTSVMITLAVSGFGPMSLAIGQVVGQTTIVIIQFVITRVGLHLGFDHAIAKESVAFCLPLALANMLSWVLLSVDNLIVSRVAGTTMLGYYALAFNISSWPMSAVGQSIRVVALPALAHLETPQIRTRVVHTLSGPLWTVSAFLGVCLAALAVPTVALLYGPKWAPAATALVGLGVFGGIRVVFDLLATFLIAAGHTKDVLVVQVVWLLAMVPGMWFGIQRFGLAGAGWAHVAVAVIVVLPAYLVCLHRAGVRPLAFMQDAVPAVAVALPTYFIISWISQQFEHPFVSLAVGGLTATAIFTLAVGRWTLRRLRALRAAAQTTDQADESSHKENPQT